MYRTPDKSAFDNKGNSSKLQMFSKAVDREKAIEV